MTPNGNLVKTLTRSSSSSSMALSWRVELVSISSVLLLLNAGIIVVVVSLESMAGNKGREIKFFK